MISSEAPRLKLNRERESRPLRLAGERYSDNRAGAFIEHVVTEDQHGASPSLFLAPDRVEIRPANLSP